MPPEQDVEDLEPVSSDGSETLDVPLTTVTDAAEGEAASPSTAEGVAKEKDVLSVVRDVVDASSKARTAAASPADGVDEGSDANGQPPKTVDNENFSDVPFGKHPRFQEVLRQRKEFQVDAVRYRNVQKFLGDSGMTGDEAADGLQIMALAKTDPAEAWKRMKPFVQKLLVAAGEVVPEDLARGVQAGELSHARAVELSRARAEAEALKARGTFEAQQRTRTANADAQAALVRTAEDWEADRRRRDPNFDAKTLPLQKEILLLQRNEGVPTTPEGVKDQLQRAYKLVGAVAAPAAAAPRKPAVKPVTGGQVSGSARPEPKSVLDIVRANRAAR